MESFPGMSRVPAAAAASPFRGGAKGQTDAWIMAVAPKVIAFPEGGEPFVIWWNQEG